MITLMAVACGLTAANLYYAQPLIGLIGPALGLQGGPAALAVTLTQIGYGLGLVLVVPLGDLIENRALVAWSLRLAAMAVLAAGLAPNGAVFLTAALAIGLFAVAAQILLPLAASLTPPEARGRVVGEVMTGLLGGILLARPASSLMAYAFGWRSIFIASAIMLVLLSLVLARLLPQRRPVGGMSYGALVGSLWPLLRDTPVLQRRAAYQFGLFGAFSVFWTAAPLELAGPAFGYSQREIAMFGLAGAAGALVAPIAGRLADRGHGRAATGSAFVITALGFLASLPGGAGSLIAMLAAALMVDGAVQLSQITGSRAIYTLAPEVRSRLNGLFIGIFFLGGACGSAGAGFAYAHGGWPWAAGVGCAFAGLPLLLWLTETRAS
jgi:predicted MFS family arabinose efflux permease